MSEIQKTILIADDDRELCEALTVRCRRMGLDVLAVDDALTALSTASFTKPDLAILDVEMPLGNGLAACEMLAGDEHLTDVPVIILTGRSDHETIRRCHSLRAYYVHKSGDAWAKIEPLLRELLGLDSPAAAPTG